jgi:hypothetical protein
MDRVVRAFSLGWLAIFVGFAPAGSKFHLTLKGPIEEDLEVQRFLTSNKTGREFAIGQRPGTHEYEIVKGPRGVDAIVPNFNSGFEFIGHTHAYPEKRGQPVFLPSTDDLMAAPVS